MSYRHQLTYLALRIGAVAILLLFPTPQAAAQNAKKQPWERQVYFGEEQMHTRNSFDAFTIGVNQIWNDAYNSRGGRSNSQPLAST